MVNLDRGLCSNLGTRFGTDNTNKKNLAAKTTITAVEETYHVK